MPFLAVSVTFLDPYFHGKDETEPEWPPSPMRLFSAMVAGNRVAAREKEWTDEKADALIWLEQHSPPDIVAPSFERTSGYVFYVPDNDGDKVFQRQDRLVGKNSAPVHLPSGCTVHYLWRLNDMRTSTEDCTLQQICTQARHTFALGWGVDHVVATGRVLSDHEAATLEGERWRPVDVPQPGYPTLRTPTDGSLADLEKVYQAFLLRIRDRRYDQPPRFRRYKTISYLPATALPACPYAAFEIGPNSVPLPATEAATIAARVRSLLCEEHNQRDFQEEFEDDPDVYLAGHVPPGAPSIRFSYLPLPSIGHRHADGMIRRFFIVEPRGGDGRHALWVQMRLRHQSLGPQVVLTDPWRGGLSTVFDHYKHPCRTWASVTPVVLPGHTRVAKGATGAGTKAERLFIKALQQAGIPPTLVSDFALQKAPYWPGSEHPRCYDLPTYLYGFALWHVKVTFRQEISGPLSIGSGRHCGLGVFAGLRD